ncbi:hypothetical protein BDZ89DRAFT_1072355 [Hymenopellis radicata]|nr:hypothetical protein BDZ89DRAFT_1072355 [Hymenopellis radicata]
MGIRRVVDSGRSGSSHGVLDPSPSLQSSQTRMSEWAAFRPETQKARIPRACGMEWTSSSKWLFTVCRLALLKISKA